MANKAPALLLLIGSAAMLLFATQVRAAAPDKTKSASKKTSAKQPNQIASVIEVVKQTTRDIIMGQPRGIRQKNPGNIRPGDNWNGMTGQDGGYLIFSSMIYGIRAMVKVLRNYQRLHGLTSVKEIIYRWAPPADNNPTDAYVKHVAEALGVGIDQFIRVDDYMPALIKVIAKHENGGDYLTDGEIAEGIKWAD